MRVRLRGRIGERALQNASRRHAGRQRPKRRAGVCVGREPRRAEGVGDEAGRMPYQRGRPQTERDSLRHAAARRGVVRVTQHPFQRSDVTVELRVRTFCGGDPGEQRIGARVLLATCSATDVDADDVSDPSQIEFTGASR